MHYLIEHLSIFTWMDILRSNERAICFLEHLEVVPKKADLAPDCPKCFGPMEATMRKKSAFGWHWACTKRCSRTGIRCYGSIYPSEGTLFENTKMPIMDTLGLIFGYLMRVGFKDMLVHMNTWRRIRKEKGISTATIMNIYTKFDEIILNALRQKKKSFKTEDKFDRIKLLKTYVKICKIRIDFQNLLTQFLMDMRSVYPCVKKEIKSETVDLPASTTGSDKDNFSENSETLDKTVESSSSSYIKSESTNISNIVTSSDCVSSDSQSENTTACGNSISLNSLSRCASSKDALNKNEDNTQVRMSAMPSTSESFTGTTASLNSNSISNSPSTCASIDDASMLRRNVTSPSNITAPLVIESSADRSEKNYENSIKIPDSCISVDTQAESDAPRKKIKLSSSSSSTAKTRRFNKKNRKIKNDAKVHVPLSTSISVDPNSTSNDSSTCASIDDTSILRRNVTTPSNITAPVIKSSADKSEKNYENGVVIPDNSVSADTQTKNNAPCKKIKLSSSSRSTSKKRRFNKKNRKIKKDGKVSVPLSTSTSVEPNSTTLSTCVDTHSDDIVSHDEKCADTTNVKTLNNTTDSVNDQIMDTTIDKNSNLNCMNTSNFEEDAIDINENNELTDFNESLESSNLYADAIISSNEDSVTDSPHIISSDLEFYEQLPIDIDVIEIVITADDN